ncbi:dual specificity protein phosphatase family protein [Rickettsiales bacterium LUAb2]
MQNIYKNLWLGSAIDYDAIKRDPNWFVVQMAKDPYHMELTNSYTFDLPKNDPNYYWVETNNRIAFNLMDYGDSNLISKSIFDKALQVIHQQMLSGSNILVHCTFGRSRSASLVLLYLAVYTEVFKSKNFLEVEKEFLEIYKNYKPSLGIRMFLMNNWDLYMGNN